MLARRHGRIATGALATALAGLAFAAPHAPARPNDEPVAGTAPKPGELLSAALGDVGSAKLTEDERQYLASRGTATPRPLEICQCRAAGTVDRVRLRLDRRGRRCGRRGRRDRPHGTRPAGAHPPSRADRALTIG